MLNGPGWNERNVNTRYKQMYKSTYDIKYKRCNTLLLVGRTWLNVIRHLCLWSYIYKKLQQIHNVTLNMHTCLDISNASNNAVKYK